ncbi:MAG TPA: energy transducer TonB [Flavobacterium sp.]|nr:energy transducer TonB [Flavobacterium sp.]
MRSESPKTTSRALVIGALLFASAIAAPVIENIISQRLAEGKEENMDKVIETALLPPPPPKEDLPPPPPPEPPKSVNDQVKFPPPEVVKKELVRDEDPPTVEDLKEADPGQKNVKGDKDAEIVIDQPTGEGEKAAEIVDDNKVYIAVEVQAGPNGGMPAFYKKYGNTLQSQVPEVDEGVGQLKFILSFVVEKDGSFTDVKVLRDPGYGVGKLATKVLMDMPKWKPAIQNGRPVRSQFTLPITIQTAQ